MAMHVSRPWSSGKGGSVTPQDRAEPRRSRTRIPPESRANRKLSAEDSGVSPSSLSATHLSLLRTGGRAKRKSGERPCCTQVAEEACSARARRRRAPRTRRTLVLGVAALLALAATAFAVPGTRHAILRVLGLRGVTIERVPVLPRVPRGEAARLGLGERIPLARARHAAGFRALLPATTTTGARTATAAYLAHDIPGGRISLLVGPLLVSEFHATAIPFAFKEIGPGTRVTFLQIRGDQAVYLSGAPHVVVFQESDGAIRRDRVVLEGNVLVWQDGPLTVRIEGARTLAQALAVARSLRSASLVASWVYPSSPHDETAFTSTYLKESQSRRFTRRVVDRPRRPRSLRRPRATRPRAAEPRRAGRPRGPARRA